MIYAWDNYPVRQFPGLWEWLETLVQKRTLSMSKIAFEEVEKKTPDCANWLKSTELVLFDIDNAILQEALKIKALLGIVGDKYGNGVGENDLLIIATAAKLNAELISDEKHQKNLPTLRRNYKIPAACAMPEVSVRCINFVDYIKRSQQVFR
ncbi:MAG: DUF4411 family protein [Gammaproteobacteria bacterium]